MPARIAAESAARKRSFSLSIGQLTFGSFLLVLAVIIITSTASVIAIRHIDSTFAELQRLQSVGDLAEDIDRRMNELRLAARDFVTDPGTAIGPGRRGRRLRSSEVLKKTRLELAPEQQDMIDGVTERLCDLPQRHRADLDADQPPRRTDRRRCRRCATSSTRRSPTAPIRDLASALSQAQSRIASALLAHNPSAAEQAAQSMRAMTIADPTLRAAVDDYADAIIAHIDPRAADRRYRQGGAGHRGPADPARHRIVARGQRAPRPRAVARFCADADRSEMAEHRARHRRRADRAVRRAAGGPPHRAAAGVDRELDPRGGRPARRTPRSRRPTSTTRSATSRAPPKCSARRWSMPTRRARRRCARSPSSGSPKRATASCSRPRSTASMSRRRAASCSTPIRRWRG